MNDWLLEQLGQFYTSEYVKKNQPWILKRPFHEFVSSMVAKKEASSYENAQVKTTYC